MQSTEVKAVEHDIMLIDELAAMFRVSVVTVRRCIRGCRFDEIPRPMRMHGRLCWYRPAVHQWLMARAVGQEIPLPAAGVHEIKARQALNAV